MQFMEIELCGCTRAHTPERSLDVFDARSPCRAAELVMWRDNEVKPAAGLSTLHVSILITTIIYSHQGAAL